MPLSVSFVAAARAAAGRILRNKALPCNTRPFAAAVGPGQPTMDGFSWHCSVQVSNVSDPFAGLTACVNRYQANCASLTGLPAVGRCPAACSLAAGGAAPASNDISEIKAIVSGTRLFIWRYPYLAGNRAVRDRNEPAFAGTNAPLE